jgi:O-antigen ligase
MARSPGAATWPAGLAVALTLAAIVGAQLAPALFFAAGVLLLGMLAYLSWHWPRAMLVLLILAPLLDRFLISLAIPAGLRPATTYASEALLLVVGVAVTVAAARSRQLIPALRHPVVAGLCAFAVIGAASAVLNGVPPAVAMAGLVFTLDAAVLFVLPRLVPFGNREAAWAVMAFVGAATAAALLAMGQVLIHPNFLGLETFAGRFSEGQRVASLLVSPNLLGLLLAMALPFSLLACLQTAGRRRWVAGGGALLLSLALLYTFSRGAWLALVLATVVVTVVVERRAIALLALIGLLTFAIALLLPRHLADPQRGEERFDLIAATLGRLEALGEGDLRVQFVENATPIILDHPLIGAGPGRYGGAVARTFGSPLYQQYTAGTVPVGRTVDNFWLHLLVETGAFGVLAFAGAIAIGVAGALRAASKSAGLRRALLAGIAAAMTVVAIDSITEMVLEGNSTAFAAWFLLGMATSLVGTAADRAPDAPDAHDAP